TYTGGTKIDLGANLSLGNGGTTGMVVGDIDNSGTLYIDRSNKVTLTGAITGSGSLIQFGSGTTTINRAETYGGGTYISGGVLALGEADAIGSGALTIEGGQLLATASFALANALYLSGNATMAAKAGTTLTLNASTPWSIDSVDQATLTFGTSGQTGT